MSSLPFSSVLVMCISLVCMQTCLAKAVDFASAGDEAAKLLSAYIKVDTTVPPGNEERGAKYLESVFKDNGIEARLFETAPGRACIYARLKGSGKQRPIVLLNHIDVVPAQADEWKQPPFSGKIVDGELWGRGALDMKGMAIAELECMLLLKRNGAKLDRDIIFLGTPDEEVGGTWGAEWFVKNHPELVGDGEYLINEGFHIDTDGQGKPLYWGIGVGEKSALWLRLTATGDAGHGSMPIQGASTNQLVKALDKLVSNPPEPMVLPAVREYFQEISKTENGQTKKLFANIDCSIKDEKAYKKLLEDKMKSAMLRNTVSLTVLKAGYKTNVIPTKAVAEIDCRLLPGVARDEFVAWVKKTIDDPGIEVEVFDWQSAKASPYNTKLFEVIKDVAGTESPGTPVVPLIVPWFTDSHHFRDLGMIAYGFEPFEVDAEHLATMHGRDERIPLKVLSDGVRRLYKVIDRLCSSNQE